MKLIKKKIISKPEVVYNLHILGDHNYIANGAVVANCHTAKSAVLKQHLEQNYNDIPIRWGLTGTLPKDKEAEMSLYCTIGPVVNKVTAKELQDKDILSNLHINAIQVQDPIFGFRDYAEELKWLTTDTKRLKAIATHIESQRKHGNILILVGRVECGKILESMIPDSVFVYGEVKTKERSTQYSEINNSEGKVLIASSGVAAVGLDLPRIFTLYLLEPGKSFVRVIQSIGRGLRKAKDKDFVNVFDVSSTAKYSKKHLKERKEFYTEAEYPYTLTKLDY